MKSSILSQGAEAIIRKADDSVVKDRVKKSYRLSILDERLRRQRTKKEVRLLDKASKLIPVPKVISSSVNKITLELIEGKKLSEHLDRLDDSLSICKDIGNNLALIHDSNIIHGDLTTSNMIYSKGKVYFIDFGLGFESSSVEDKAVDLHLLKQALEAKHYNHFNEFFDSVLKGYDISKNASLVLLRLRKVESRGRYKEQY